MRYLIFLIVLFATATYAMSATLQDIQEVTKDLQDVCKQQNISCKIYIQTDAQGLNAYSDVGNVIVLNLGLVQTMSKNEVKAVGLHELGHLAYKHPQILNNLSKTVPALTTNKTIRQGMEYQADEFATLYYKNRNEHNYLIDALGVLVKAKGSKASITHPVATDRIKRMQELYK